MADQTRPETGSRADADEGYLDGAELADSGMSRREFVIAAGAGSVAAATLGVGVGAGTAHASGTPIYRIHPAIGVARVGNADPASYFIGPEIPGSGPTDAAPGWTVPGSYKVEGLVRPQACRFRIWEYKADATGRLAPVGEVNLSTRGVSAIKWTVHVANRKSSFYEENGPTGERFPAGPLRNPTVSDRGSLESDFGPRSISGVSHGPVEFRPVGASGERVVRDGTGQPVIDYLGQLRTDDHGRLLFLGGKGKSVSNVSPPQPLHHWSNNNSWFDDIADGWVTATVTINGITVPMDDAGKAWVLTAPPDFAPRVASAISLYDVLYDMSVRSLAVPNNALYFNAGPLDRLRQLNGLWAQWQLNPTGTLEFGSFKPDYLTEIWPILHNAVNYVYVTGLVNFKHSSMLDPALGDPSPAAASARGGVFAYLRPPDDAVTKGPGTMPLLYGDDWYKGRNVGGGGELLSTPARVPQYLRYGTLTHTQFALLRSWNAGNFIAAPGIGTPTAAVTPHGLDRAALENCIGAAFFPGIECGWQMRNPKMFIEPFRIDVNHATSQFLNQSGAPENTPIAAGHFSRQLAIPWQADFNDCVRLLNLGWWPSQRPDDVFLHATDKLTDRVPWARPDSKWPSGSTTSSWDDMVQHWWQFGFVVDVDHSGSYIETERAAQIP